MIGSDIAKRYAKALFEIGREQNTLEQTYDELRMFSTVLSENENLQEFLANPMFDLPDKKAVVVEILDTLHLSLMTANFLKLLVDKRRIDILPDVEASYLKYIDDVLNKARVSVKTAFPLSDELSDQIRNTLETITGKTVEVVIEEDPSLVGGIVVGIGDTLYDGSIRAQLSSIRELIREEM